VIINKGSMVADDSLSALVKQHTTDDGQKSLEEIFLSLTEL
jgi:hypothetical protein